MESDGNLRVGQIWNVVAQKRQLAVDLTYPEDVKRESEMGGGLNFSKLPQFQQNCAGDSTMTLRKNMAKLAEKRPLEEKGNESANKKPRGKNAPKLASNKLEATKTGYNITIRPTTPDSNFVNGDKSVPEGWKVSSHKEDGGRSWVMCPQVFLH